MKIGPAVSGPANRLGTAFRRLGVVRAIKQTRVEETIRFEDHGDRCELNQKMIERATEAERAVIRAEREIGL